MQWLLEDVRPNYHSISDFRKNNPAALKNTFKLFGSFLKDVDLIGVETIAIDGTKSRAHNSKKANFNQKKIDKHLAYIEAKTQEYLDALKENDAKENPSKIHNIQQYGSHWHDHVSLFIKPFVNRNGYTIDPFSEMQT